MYFDIAENLGVTEVAIALGTTAAVAFVTYFTCCRSRGETAEDRARKYANAAIKSQTGQDADSDPRILKVLPSNR